MTPSQCKKRKQKRHTIPYRSLGLEVSIGGDLTHATIEGKQHAIPYSSLGLEVSVGADLTRATMEVHHFFSGIPHFIWRLRHDRHVFLNPKTDSLLIQKIKLLCYRIKNPIV